MKRLSKCALLFALALASAAALPREQIELDTTIIKGNKELPKILFIVPWQDMDESTDQAHTLKLHSLFGDIFEPVVPPSGRSDPASGTAE